MKSYFGIIQIGEIKNEQAASFVKQEETSAFIPMTESNTRFVHYPDCQQLIIWLTHPGREYGSVRLRDNTNNAIAEEWQVSDKLSGSIQLIWDTLEIAPGTYRIEIDWINGWQHHINIEKFEEGIAPPANEPDIIVKEEDEKDKEPIQYRDGFGNLLINEDLVLREKVLNDLYGKFSRHIEYEGNFRGGTIIYIENDFRIEFSHEMGGGNCMFSIDIPTKELWEAATRTPLKRRKDILEFVAERVQIQQASNCNYVINDKEIIYYYK